MTKNRKKLWIGLSVMALLSPLGILLPSLLGSGDAWGEWGKDRLQKLLGYLPEGLRKYTDLWKAPVPDYNFGGDGASMTVQVISYVASAVLGIAVVVLVIYFITRIMVKNE